MTGDEVRAATFPGTGGKGYKVDEVDDLVAGIADELDAGRSPKAVIDSSTLSRERNEFRSGYKTDVVDSFLEDVQREEPPTGDIWQSGPISNWLIAEAGRQDDASLSPKGRRRRFGLQLGLQCDEEWRRFQDLPGTHLWLRRPSRKSGELVTSDGTTIATVLYSGNLHIGPAHVTIAGISYSRTPRNKPGQDASSPTWDKKRMLDRWTYVNDTTGEPVMHVGGRNDQHWPGFIMSLSEQQTFRFPVRESNWKNAVMTAIDDAAHRAIRFRFADRLREPAQSLTAPLRGLMKMAPHDHSPIEVAVEPGYPLQDELILSIAVAAKQLPGFFMVHGGGG
jgi:DivIVA domain-containing protein